MKRRGRVNEEVGKDDINIIRGKWSLQCQKLWVEKSKKVMDNKF